MEELIRRFKEGDISAFDELIISLQSDLYKIARMRLSCQDDINDAVQETIIQAYKNIKKIKEPHYFKTWIIKVLINNCNNIFKKYYKKEIIKLENEEEINLYANHEEEKIGNLDFYNLIEKLNYKEREAITLYYLFEFTTKEISKILKEPENTIKSRISRAKGKLKKYIKEKM